MQTEKTKPAIREKILRTATLLYTQYGIKGVSMNQIAGEMGISKKTIYMEFEDKESLVLACIDNEIERIRKSILKTKSQTDSAIEAIVTITMGILRHASTRCPAFYKDLTHFFGASEQFTKFKQEYHEQCLIHMQQGVKEGDFLPELDYELVSTILVEQFAEMKLEYQSTMLIAFLRGISTEKGLKKLAEISEGQLYRG